MPRRARSSSVRLMILAVGSPPLNREPVTRCFSSSRGSSSCPSVSSSSSALASPLSLSSEDSCALSTTIMFSEVNSYARPVPLNRIDNASSRRYSPFNPSTLTSAPASPGSMICTPEDSPSATIAEPTFLRLDIERHYPVGLRGSTRRERSQAQPLRSLTATSHQGSPKYSS